MQSEVKNYWIVNNPYHLNYIEQYGEYYPGENVYICIPHRPINFVAETKVLTINRYTGIKSLIPSLKNIRKSISDLGITKHDRIFVFNGQELINNVAISYIFSNFSKNIIVVDDGSSGYQFYLHPTPLSRRLSDQFKVLFYKYVLGFKCVIKQVSNLFYFTLHPSFVKQIIFPYPIEYSGDVAVKVIATLQKAESADMDDNSIIFLSQPFYLADPGYVKFDDYRALLKKIISHLSARYESIFFKLHPNDYLILKEDIRNYDRVILIDDDTTFESLLISNRSASVYSFNSNGLLQAICSGRKTYWLYKLISKQCASDFAYLDNIIRINRGEVINDINDIK